MTPNSTNTAVVPIAKTCQYLYIGSIDLLPVHLRLQLRFSLASLADWPCRRGSSKCMAEGAKSDTPWYSKRVSTHDVSACVAFPCQIKRAGLETWKNRHDIG